MFAAQFQREVLMRVRRDAPRPQVFRNALNCALAIERRFQQKGLDMLASAGALSRELMTPQQDIYEALRLLEQVGAIVRTPHPGGANVKVIYPAAAALHFFEAESDDEDDDDTPDPGPGEEAKAAPPEAENVVAFRPRARVQLTEPGRKRA